jgi:hypothetical protein
MQLTIQEMITMNFQQAPDVVPEPELALLDKQAIVDRILSGQPLPADFAYYPQPTPEGEIYYVTKGWQILNAIRQFADDQFPTWTDEDKRRYYRDKRQQ